MTDVTDVTDFSKTAAGSPFANGISYTGLVNTIVASAPLVVLRDVLRDVQKNGFPGEHHLYISFDLTDPGVHLAPALAATYGPVMTIVLQHQYSDLLVEDSGFSVVLAFQGVPHRIVVPFSAIRRYHDPAANEGFIFTPEDVQNAFQDNEPVEAAVSEPDEDTPAESTPAGDGEEKVVSLATWRNRG